MNAPPLPRLFRPLLLVIVCGQSISSGYSVGSSISRHGRRSSKANIAVGLIPPPAMTTFDEDAPVAAAAGRDDDDHDDDIGRRAFFRHGASRLTTSSATVAVSAAIAADFIPLPARASSHPQLPSLGSPAPDFSLMNTRGQLVTLDTLSSSSSSDEKRSTQRLWTVLYFYPGAFTSGCTIEARKFQEELPNFRELGAQIVGVSVDGVEKNSEFCTKEGLDFYMLTDEGGKVSKAYGSSLSIPGFGTFSNRQTYIIDPQKNVRWVFVDVESRIPKHPAEVLEKLKELQQVKE
mmetsp:Transcript_21143/g.51062  ORF Transcript_21143/g.51062 Transcript_21143/m.51062 type:complete len:291 (+) Transcript_21143:80-952(+)